MVVALEEIWFRTYAQTWTAVFALLTHNGMMTRLFSLSSTRSFTAIRSYWRQNRTKNSWASTSRSTRSLYGIAPLEIPVKSWHRILHHRETVQLSGFVSRPFPHEEQFRGFAALHRLYSHAGFAEADLVSAAKPIRKYLRVSKLW